MQSIDPGFEWRIFLRVTYRKMASRFPPFSVFVTVVADGRFALLSDDEVIAFSEQVKTRKPETTKHDAKRSSGNLSKRYKKQK